MAVIALILGTAGLFVAGFAAWYTMWHRRMAAALEPVPVGTHPSAPAVRRATEQPGDTIR